MDSGTGSDDVDVRVRESSMVFPSEPTPNSPLSLSTIDTFLLPFQGHSLLVYDNADDLLSRRGLGREAFASTIREALGRALAQYYPMAGRIEPGPARPRVVFSGGRGGVPFDEAVSGQLTRPRLEHGPRCMGEWWPLLGRHGGNALDGGPPLVVQLTWLADGSAALAFGVSHGLCDGPGGAQFLGSLAELARGAATSCEPNPVWERHLLAPSPGDPDPNIQDYPQFLDDVCDFSFSKEPLVPTSLDFTRSEIDKLKSRCSEPFTSFEVMSAHVWRCWARALGLPPDKATRLHFAVNFRGRIQKDLPKGFYGNTFLPGCARATVGELESGGPGYGPGLVRRAKERVDDKYVRDVIQLLSRGHKDTPSPATLFVTTWIRLGFEKLDFGLGQPAYVGPICSGDACHILPIPDQADGARVVFCVPASAVDTYRRLVRDLCCNSTP